MFEHFGDFPQAAAATRRFRAEVRHRVPDPDRRHLRQGRRRQGAAAAHRRVRLPTTIWVDRSGTVRKIHAGFSGPATGSHYEELTREFTEFTRELLAEPRPGMEPDHAVLRHRFRDRPARSHQRRGPGQPRGRPAVRLQGHECQVRVERSGRDAFCAGGFSTQADARDPQAQVREARHRRRLPEGGRAGDHRPDGAPGGDAATGRGHRARQEDPAAGEGLQAQGPVRRSRTSRCGSPARTATTCRT